MTGPASTFLSGKKPEDPDTTIVYVGERDNVRQQPIQHNADETKAFWERTCVVTSKDRNITKAHGRYLEARLFGLVMEAGRATPGNGNKPGGLTLPEADQSDMDFFVEQIRLILPVLGFDFLKATPRVTKPMPSASPGTETSSEQPLFEINTGSSACRLRRRRWTVSSSCSKVL